MSAVGMDHLLRRGVALLARRLPQAWPRACAVTRLDAHARIDETGDNGCAGRPNLAEMAAEDRRDLGQSAARGTM
jgi:hypothetical protein